MTWFIFQADEQHAFYFIISERVHTTLGGSSLLCLKAKGRPSTEKNGGK